MSDGPSAPLPSPRAHLAASLRLFDALADRAGGVGRFPGALTWRAALERPRALPASVSKAWNGLKLDGYLTRGPDGPAWGFACNDRWEGRGFWRVVRALVEELDGGYDLPAAEGLRAALGHAPSVTLSLGFDRQGEPPRLKLYFQESRWEDGVSSVGALRALGEEVLGACLPPGLPDALRPGVVTMGLHAGGARDLKLYLGGAQARALAEEAARWVPVAAEELAVLADGMERSSPSRSFHYLTLRLGAGAPRVALNKIYEHERLGFGAGSGLEDAWGEVRALFLGGGRADGWAEIEAVRSALAGLRLVPTATALERSGESADAYLAAWPAP